MAHGGGGQRRCLMILMILVFLQLLSGVAGAQAARFALVAGSNRGRDPAKTLRYAERDAARFAETLTSLGGFDPERVYLLQQPTSEEMLAGLAKLDRDVRRATTETGAKVLAVVYFSGHADGVHLELGDDQLAFAALRERLEGLGAAIKILFIDSCQSGGVTRYKGGRPGPAFDIVFSETIDADGTAILTSSAAGEKSQESGRLRGSFFTHFLLSGLKGTADFDQDQRITLNEIYQYTYSKTVAETARTLGGTQHPTYDYRMTGRGTVVLTDLTRGESQLQFGPELAGSYMILRKDTVEVVAEVTKAAGGWRTIALPAGSYYVATRHDERMLAQTLRVRHGTRVRVRQEALIPDTALEATLAKGGDRARTVEIGVYYGLLSGALRQYAALHQGIVGLRIDLGPFSLFPRFSVGATQVDQGALRYRILLISGDLLLAWRFQRQALDLFAGLGVGAGYGRQTLPGDIRYTGTLFTYTGMGGLDIPLTTHLALSAVWEVGSHVYRAESRLDQHLLLRIALGVGYHF